MKIILILITVALLSFLGVNSIAQVMKAAYPQPVQSVDRQGHAFASGARTTAIGDTVVLSDITTADTLTLYAADSGGYITGTDYWGDQAFAELYDIDGYDSSVVVLGVFAEFGGTVSPASGKMVTFSLWSQSVPFIVSSTLSYNGFPGSLLDTVDAPLTQLGVGPSADTLKEFLFNTPSLQSGAFYAGYSIAYNYAALDGDTIGLASSKNGERTGSDYTATFNVTLIDSAWDTVINVQNATMGADYNWYDNYTQDDSLYNNLAIFPIVAVSSALLSGVKGITRNNLTFFGNYPNPADNSTEIKFSLAEDIGVTIQVMDMGGHTLNTLQPGILAAGTHLIPVNTAGMPSGDYLYLIRTSGGDGIAGKMTVVH
jgi:hypothetical protein